MATIDRDGHVSCACCAGCACPQGNDVGSGTGVVQKKHIGYVFHLKYRKGYVEWQNGFDDQRH